MARPRVRKDPKRGTWIVEYYQDKKQHRLKGFKTKRDADARADEIAGEVRKGVHVPDSASFTVADACEAWVQRGRDLKLEKETIRPYENHVDLHLKPMTDQGKLPKWEGGLGKVKLVKLNAPLANAVMAELNRRLSGPMARKVMSSFKAILDEAVNQGMVGVNAASTVKIRRRERGQNKIHAGIDFPTKEEIAAVIRVIDGRWRPLIITLAVLWFAGVGIARPRMGRRNGPRHPVPKTPGAPARRQRRRPR